MNFTEVKLQDNHGVLQFDVPLPLFIKIKEKCKLLENTKLNDEKLSYNKRLIGHLEKSLIFHPQMEFRTWIQTLAKNYTEYFSFYTQVEKVLDTCWVNFQKKHEYNPFHNHTGLLSFVIWVKIPYRLEDEDIMPNSVNANNKENGRFCLFYNSNFSSISTLTINLDSSYEGKGIIFPAAANHCVYPFYTSDEYRVSIAGNIGQAHLAQR
jgi:hypothetical protein